MNTMKLLAERAETLRDYANRLEKATEAYHDTLNAGDKKAISAAWWVRQKLVLEVERYLRTWE